MNRTLALLFLLPFSNLLAQEVFDCELLIGNWVGEHRYDDGQFNRWNANYSADNSLEIKFFTEDDTELGTQSGTWECDGIWVITRMQERGQEYQFEYQIRALDIFRYVYESAAGPVFTSYKGRALSPD